MFKRQSYQIVGVGERFGPVPLLADDHFVKGFAFAVDDFGPLYFEAAGACGPWAHSSGVAKKLLHIFMEHYDPQNIKSVHLKEDIWYHAPVPVGETLTISGEITGKFVRNGRTSVILESAARDSKANLLVTQRSIEIWPSDEKTADTTQAPLDGLSSRRFGGEWPADARECQTVADVSGPNARLPVLSKTIHQDQMSMFVGANENWRNIHNNPALAKEAGYNGTIMSGMIQACWFSQMMVSFFGEGFLSGGQLGVTFLVPVKAGETIECRAVVRSVAPDGAVAVEFWSLNAAGRMTAGGWAIGQQ